MKKIKSFVIPQIKQSRCNLFLLLGIIILRKSCESYCFRWRDRRLSFSYTWRYITACGEAKYRDDNGRRLILTIRRIQYVEQSSGALWTGNRSILKKSRQTQKRAYEHYRSCRLLKKCFYEWKRSRKRKKVIRKHL